MYRYNTIHYNATIFINLCCAILETAPIGGSSLSSIVGPTCRPVIHISFFVVLADVSAILIHLLHVYPNIVCCAATVGRKVTSVKAYCMYYREEPAYTASICRSAMACSTYCHADLCNDPFKSC